jgi:hypothetical protein
MVVHLNPARFGYVYRPIGWRLENRALQHRRVADRDGVHLVVTGVGDVEGAVGATAIDRGLAPEFWSMVKEPIAVLVAVSYTTTVLPSDWVTYRRLPSG